MVKWFLPNSWRTNLSLFYVFCSLAMRDKE